MYFLSQMIISNSRTSLPTIFFPIIITLLLWRKSFTRLLSHWYSFCFIISSYPFDQCTLTVGNCIHWLTCCLTDLIDTSINTEVCWRAGRCRLMVGWCVGAGARWHRHFRLHWLIFFICWYITSWISCAKSEWSYQLNKSYLGYRFHFP